MDTTWRDAHQSLLATRMRTSDLIKIEMRLAHPRASRLEIRSLYPRLGELCTVSIPSFAPLSGCSFHERSAVECLLSRDVGRCHF
eukprot:scaffold43941_cov33-Tisochrysis_lutea.AAC.4